ncbi:hypothetical protein TNCV_3771141 [Trichonephila clavipes]|nr:hypothetical protein TNCV_3771141 [Trichonephila clavipes]
MPGTRYHQETITGNIMTPFRWCRIARLGGEGGILCSITDLHVQIGAMSGQIYWDVILEQHVLLFRCTMDAEFVFMDDNARPHRADILNECLQLENITRMD